MLPYYTTSSYTNVWTIRTEPIESKITLKLNLQDMFLLKNTSSSISTYTYDTYESLLSFSASISGAIDGGEYRATITSGSTEVWHGSVQVYGTGSICNFDKADYTNQNTQYISNQSANEYIILD
jgi:hypothetical protein